MTLPAARNHGEQRRNNPSIMPVSYQAKACIMRACAASRRAVIVIMPHGGDISQPNIGRAYRARSSRAISACYLASVA